MKGGGIGSVGSAVGIGARSAGIGARASGARTGSKSFGVSLSPEARTGGAVATAFSSRGLAAHRTSPISRESITRASTPKSMFNMNRSPVPGFTVPHEAKPKSSISLLNMNHGREVKSPFARTESLRPKPGMFKEIGRVKEKVPGVPRVSNASRAEIAPRVGQKSKEVRLYQNQKVKLNEVPPQLRLGNESVARPSQNNVEVVPRPKEKISKAEVRTIPKQKAEIAAKMARKEFRNSVRVSKALDIKQNLPPTVVELIKLDIKLAQKMVVNRAKAENITLAEATQKMAQTLAKRHEGRVRLKTQTQPKTDVQTQTQPVTSTEAKTQTETQTAVLQEVQKLTNEEEKKDHIPPEKNEIKRISFKKQLEVNAARVKAFVDAARNLLRYRNAADASLTGKDIAYAAGKFAEEQISEVALPINTDATLKEVSQEVSGLGAVENIEAFESAVEQITSGHSAIQLTTREGDAKDEDAQKVYGVALDGQVGYFGEEKETGKFEKKLVAGELYFVTQRQARQTS